MTSSTPELYRESLADYFVVVAAIKDWDAAVPSCPKWTVRELVNHVAGEELWSAALFAGLTIQQVGDKLDGDLLRDDPMRAAFRANDDAYEVSFIPNLMTRVVHLSYGDATGAEFLNQLMADHLIHTWDLANALRVQSVMNTKVMRAVKLWFTPEQERMLRMADEIGPVPSGRAYGPQEELLARFGREA